jgi:hypothetical protein
MSNLIFDFAAGRSPNDHPLTEAARVALEADLTPRIMKVIVDHDGLPIEIPNGEPLSKSSKE